MSTILSTNAGSAWASFAASTWDGLKQWGRRCTRGATKMVALLTMAAVLCAVPQATGGAPTPKPAVATPAKPAAKPHSTSSKLRPQNQHLQRRAAQPKVIRRGHARVLRHRKVVHHATGTITGTVNASNAYPLPGASVHLAKLNGHKLKSRRARHTTTVDANGEFTMHTVRPGKYRVVASKHSHGKSYAKTRVRGHVTSNVAIKLK